MREKSRKQVPSPSRDFSRSSGPGGGAFPEIFNPRSSRHQLFGADLSLVPEGPTGPGSPLKVTDHGEMWGGPREARRVGVHAGGIGQQLFTNWRGRVWIS